ncbi:MAG: FAD-dependent oxidoreductase [Dethiobacter sp.]|jgi:NADPH-dependent glutamate synthase beta subunit-like oxidoreductase/NAD-dependent dihydropyrimidine dehydrogenase PreA subunit|nr:MAG: FAD-dependent oxidoreductase [Dethiobacter sp.]
MPSSGKNKYSQPPAYLETVPTLVNKTGLWRFLTPVRREKVSPCRMLCPLENGIPRWMNKAREGDWEGAWHIMKEYNPFPAITGYTCYRFCQEKCSRSSLDDAVAISEVEKAVGLWRHKSYGLTKAAADRDKPGKNRAAGPKKVAVVGSGPAGLSCAYYLNVLGAEVTVLEKMPLAGGLLATGIPEYRLPRDILRKELDLLQAEGIVIKTGLEVGKDLSFHDLEKNFDAVLLAVGAQESRPLKIAGDGLPGVTGAVEFLRDMHLGRLGKVSGRVIVAGGGNAAVDAACAATLQGAGEVTLFYRRSREEMPAHPDEINAARETGVNFVFQTVLTEIMGEEKVQKVRAARTAPSRRGEALQVLPDTYFDLECDLIIIAAGQESGLPKLTSLSFSAEGISQNENIILAAGDALSGPATVAAAIFSGRKAALSLAGVLWPENGRKDLPVIAPPFNGKEEAVALDALNPYLFPRQGRFSSAQEEAGRCFSCGICNKCGVCWVFCPDLAVAGSREDFEILLDYCKGCGICVKECPAGALHMEEVTSSGA